MVNGITLELSYDSKILMNIANFDNHFPSACAFSVEEFKRNDHAVKTTFLGAQVTLCQQYFNDTMVITSICWRKRADC